MLGKVVLLVAAVAIIGSCAQNGTGQSAADVAANLTRRATPTLAPADANTYARLCPALAAYNKIDEAGQAALSAGIITLAQGAKNSDDPGVRAFAGAVPSLVQGQGKSRAAARDFLLRECEAH